MNYIYSFGNSVISYPSTKYQTEVVDKLLENKIEFVCSDWRNEENWISTISKDEIEYVTVGFSGKTEDLWTQLPYLTYDNWFNKINPNNCYILLSDQVINTLATEFSPEYKDTLMNNLELVYSYTVKGNTFYFLKGTEKIYRDLAN